MRRLLLRLILNTQQKTFILIRKEFCLALPEIEPASIVLTTLSIN